MTRAWILVACAAATFPGAAAAEAGVLLVGNKSAHTVWALDLATGEKILELPTGQGPHEIAVSPDRPLAVVANYGAEEPGNTLTVIDWSVREVVRTIDLGEDTRPHGMAFLPGNRLAVTTEGSRRLVVVDLVAGEVVQRVDVGGGIGHMVAVSPGGRLAWVTHIGAGTLTKVDLQDGVVLGVVETGAGAEGVAVAREGREVWVTNRADDTISVVDAESLEHLVRLPSPGFPIRIAMSADGGHALVTNARAATVSVFACERRELVATAVLAEEGMQYKPTLLGQAALPIGVIVHPDGGRAYVAISGADQVAVLDGETWQVVDLWTTGREPDALGIIAAGR